VARAVQHGTTMANPWIVVLAGGEGMRLKSLTRALYGFDLPKQFAVLVGDQSLLQLTVERAERITTRDRIVVAVTAHHEAIAREQLAPYGGITILAQPRSLDTGVGMLFPLAYLLAIDPLATVAFLPSDHYIPNVAPLLDVLRAPTAGRLALVGVAPTAPEPEYGWIVPGARLRASARREVTRFVEKPTAAIAANLFAGGALWNTFIQIGELTTYWDLAREHLPANARAFESFAAAVGSLGEASALAEAYSRSERANFSKDVLAHATELAVAPIAGSGWNDWGTPRRVFESLAGTPQLDALLSRIRGPRAEVEALYAAG